MLRALFLAIAVTTLSAPAMAQQQPRLQQAPKLETSQDWYREVGGRLQRFGGRAVAQAAREGLTGQFETKVGFTVSSNGTVSNIHLVEGSGNDDADKVALQFPQLAAPFSPFTPDMTDAPQSIVAPLAMHFDLPESDEEVSPDEKSID